MSNNKNQENKTQLEREKELRREKDKLTIICFISWIIISILIVLVSLGVKYIKETKSSSTNTSTESLNNTESLTGTEEPEKHITTYEYEHEEVDEETAQKVKEQVIEYIDMLKSNNTYVNCRVGGDLYQIYLYNKNKEGFGQLSDGSSVTIYKNDGQVVNYDTENNVLGIGTEIDLLDISRNAIKLLDSQINDVKLYDMKLISSTKVDEASTETEQNSTPAIKEYRLDVIGDNNVKGCYGDNEEYSEFMVDGIKEQLGEDQLHYIFVYRISDEAMSLGCYYIQDENEYTYWTMDGYSDIGDWQLDKEWYNISYKYGDDQDNLNESLDDDKVADLLEGLIAELENLLTPEEESTEQETTESETEVQETEQVQN